MTFPGPSVAFLWWVLLMLRVVMLMPVVLEVVLIQVMLALVEVQVAPDHWHEWA